MRKLILSAVGTAGCAFAMPAYAQSVATVAIEATVPESCEISSSDTVSLDIGSIGTETEATSEPQTVSFTCTEGTTYTVDVGDGANVDAGQRRLAGTVAGSFLAYNLLTGTTGTDPFGDLTTEATSDGSAQDLVFRVQIPAAATGVQRAAGTYSDSLTLTVNY